VINIIVIMDMFVIRAAFWVSLLALIHAYVLYPLSLSVVPVQTDSQSRSDGSEKRRPTVTVAIVAYNECEVIKAKIENSLALEYPRERLRIVVVSDGSTDGTDAIVRSYADRGIDLFRVEGRVGKTACQNRIVAAVDSDIVVFSDAHSLYEPAAIHALVDGFGSNIGCVVGDLRHVEEGIVHGEHLYWRYEQLVKRLESRVSTLVTGTGPIYAVQRSSYVPLPSEAISDFAEPLAIVERGEQVRYVPEAVAWERMSGSVSTELRRRVRIATRVWHTGTRQKRLLNPFSRPGVAYQLFSHRGLLGLTPLLLLTLVASTVALAVGEGGIYSVALGFQLSVYSLAFFGALTNWLGLPTPSSIAVLYYLVFANIGLLVGFTNYLCGKNVVTWETLGRSAEDSD
jgi:cellulose synthase/poly-beta-1,6-N-acetylglucosamine synthase-like glycosyltransferase